MQDIQLIPLTQSSLTEDCQHDDCENAARVSVSLTWYDCYTCGTAVSLCVEHYNEAIKSIAVQHAELVSLGVLEN